MASTPEPNHNAEQHAAAAPVTMQFVGLGLLTSRGDDKRGDPPALTEAQKSMLEEEISYYSAEDNEHGDDNIWGLLSGSLGNIYEWYDFAVYGLLAPEIGACFFPNTRPELQLINSFGVYLAAFLMRPIGAILFGEIGDRHVGRKHALVASIVMITVPSVLMGLLPGYNLLGNWSPILLVLLRMMQGLSVGGQLAGSYVLSIEQSSKRSRGLRGSICDASSVGGFFLASAVTASVRHIFTVQQVDDWAWRVPFWMSVVFAPILYVIVNQTEESKFWQEKKEEQQQQTTIGGGQMQSALSSDSLDMDYQHYQQQQQTSNTVHHQYSTQPSMGTQHTLSSTATSDQPAFLDLLSSPFRRRQLAGMVGTLSAVASSFYILFLWTPVYVSELRGHVSQASADLMNFVVVGCYIFFLVLSGYWSDQFPHRKDLIRIGLPGIIVACPTMLGLLESDSWAGYMIGQLQMAFCLSLVQGSIAAWEVELWMREPTLSYTGVAIGHNLASTLFGGTMPLVATGLYYKASQYVNYDKDDWVHSLLPRLIPGFYISLLGCLSLYCISFIVKHPHDMRIGTPHPAIRQAAAQQQSKKKNYRKKYDFGGGGGGLQIVEDHQKNGGDYNPPQVSS